MKNHREELNELKKELEYVRKKMNLIYIQFINDHRNCKYLNKSSNVQETCNISSNHQCHMEYCPLY